MNTQNCRDALAMAQQFGLERLDAQLLLLHALGKPDSERAWLLAHDTEPLAQPVAQLFRQLSQRRAAGEPLAYIVGNKGFFGLQLRVDARVLVPRPDTETLVEWALELLQHPGLPPEPALLDLGTGSGAIALAIAHNLRASGRTARVLAVDASAQALEVAAENASRLGLALRLRQGNWLADLDEGFDLIVSNPPYIASADPHLAALAHEPLAALAAGPDGLSDLRQITGQAPAHLQPGGWLLLEHGYDQAEAVRQLLRDQGFLQVQSRRDLAGIERCSGGQWPGG